MWTTHLLVYSVDSGQFNYDSGQSACGSFITSILSVEGKNSINMM